MVYILDTELIKNKSIYFALKKILGIGKKDSITLSRKIGCSINFKIKYLSDDQIFGLLKFIEKSKILINDDLKKSQLFILKKLILIKSYRGLRRLKGLPVRGQRTHTNAKTAKRYKKAFNCYYKQ
nr:ribosomal protein S13 [Lithodesmioides sp. mgcode 4]